MSTAGVVSFLCRTVAAMTKDEWKEAITRVINALNAVVDPMLIRASSKFMTVERPMQYMGRDVRGSTFADYKVSA